MPDAVPVCLVTGFLGAGKSTLVGHVLHGAHGLRVAVVVNELGAGLGLEKALVQEGGSEGTRRGPLARLLGRGSPAARCSAAQVEEFVELPNGCICCTVKDRRAGANS